MLYGSNITLYQTHKIYYSLLLKQFASIYLLGPDIYNLILEYIMDLVQHTIKENNLLKYIRDHVIIYQLTSEFQQMFTPDIPDQYSYLHIHKDLTDFIFNPRNPLSHSLLEIPFGEIPHPNMYKHLQDVWTKLIKTYIQDRPKLIVFTAMSIQMDNKLFIGVPIANDVTLVFEHMTTSYATTNTHSYT